MICNLCGGTESYVHDGVEYCRECSMQFKGSREEESSDETFSRRSLLSTPDIQKTKKAKDKKKTYAPWITIEAYNLILSKQISALIKLGCSVKLKTVVLHIWAQYLQKCEYAFKNDQNCNENLPCLSAFPIKRDVQLLYGDGRAEQKQDHSKRKTNIRIKKCSSKSNTAIEVKIEKTLNEPTDDSLISSDINSTDFIPEEDSSVEPPSGPSSSEFTEEENPDPPALSSDNCRKKKNLKYSTHAVKLKKPKKSKRKNDIDFKYQETAVHHMTLAKTLSFCHLGLLYTEDQLFLSDLIRLANDGEIPYIDVTRHFPSTMQLQTVDYNYFTKHSAPEMKKISLMSARLFDFLKLPKFKNPDLLPIVCRFVKDLNLPNDIIPVIKILIDKLKMHREPWYITKKTFTCYAIPAYEIQALSVIIVALKMLFVLDGKFEVEHSEVMVKINSIIEGDKFFVWNDWKQQTELKEYLFVKSGATHTNMNRLDSLSADRIIQGYPYTCLNSELYSLATEERRNGIEARNVFKSVLDDIVPNNILKRKPTSFLLKQHLHNLITEWKSLPLFKDSEDIDFSFISRDFSYSKLYYRPTDTSGSNDLINLLLSSLYESAQLLHILPNSSFYSEKLLRTSKKYWHADISSKTLLYDIRELWLEQFPSTFQWLLKLLSKYLQVSNADLYMEVKYIENKLFVH